MFADFANVRNQLCGRVRSLSLSEFEVNDIVDHISAKPLWMKLSLSTGVLSYLYLRYRWTALNDCGVEIIEPSLTRMGTMTQYFGTDTYSKWAREELTNQNRLTVGFYRGATPTILTVDPELIRLVFSTNFSSFPIRVPVGESIGGGPIFNVLLNLMSNIPKWKRLRSTLTEGFSTKNLNQMVPTLHHCAENFTSKIGNLNNEPIDVTLVASNYVVDAFTTASFSISMTSDTPIPDFDKVPFVKALIDFHTPRASVLIPLMIPYGGEILDGLGINIWPKDGMKFFTNFCNQILSERKKQPQHGRKTDFINIMLRSEIDESAKNSATKGITQNEMIAQLFIFFAAGYSTTVTAISVVLYYLAKYPRYISEIRKEAENIKIIDCNSFSFDNMPFISAVLNEALRLVPPVGFIQRVAVLDKELEILGIKFKNDFNVEVPYDILHTHKDFWGPNSSDFYPERWMEQPDLEKSWFYQPFGGGPRNCIGMRLALIEIKIGILKIIQNFDPVIIDSNAKFRRNSFGFIESNPPLKMKFIPINIDDAK